MEQLCPQRQCPPRGKAALASLSHALGAPFLLTQELCVVWMRRALGDEPSAGTHLSSRIILFPETKLEGLP